MNASERARENCKIDVHTNIRAKECTKLVKIIESRRVYCVVGGCYEKPVGNWAQNFSVCIRYYAYSLFISHTARQHKAHKTRWQTLNKKCWKTCCVWSPQSVRTMVINSARSIQQSTSTSHCPPNRQISNKRNLHKQQTIRYYSNDVIAIAIWFDCICFVWCWTAGKAYDRFEQLKHWLETETETGSEIEWETDIEENGMEE